MNAVRHVPPPSTTSEPASATLSADPSAVALADVALTNDLTLTDIAILGLSRNPRHEATVLRHERANDAIELRSGPAGLATLHDYDLLLFAIANIAHQARLFRQGKAPQLSRIFSTNAAAIIDRLGLEHPLASSQALDAAIDRLKNTNAKIISTQHHSRLSAGYLLLSASTQIQHTSSGDIGAMELVLPDWMYLQAVAPTTTAGMALAPDYTRITSPLARAIYHLVRKAAFRGQATLSLETIAHHLGGTYPNDQLAEDLKSVVQNQTFPGHDLGLVAPNGIPFLLIRPHQN